jgi:hypothetical protein
MMARNVIPMHCIRDYYLVRIRFGHGTTEALGIFRVRRDAAMVDMVSKARTALHLDDDMRPVHVSITDADWADVARYPALD